MYELIKNVIEAKTYKDSNALLYKIQRMFVEGELTEEQYVQLRELMAAENPVKRYDVEEEIDRIWAKLRELEAKIDAMPEPEPSPEPEPEPEDIPDWVQPTGAHDAYQTGDKVRYKGQVYESLIDGNVWAPDVYPAGWRLVEEANG